MKLKLRLQLKDDAGEHMKPRPQSLVALPPEKEKEGEGGVGAMVAGASSGRTYGHDHVLRLPLQGIQEQGASSCVWGVGEEACGGWAKRRLLHWRASLWASIMAGAAAASAMQPTKGRRGAGAQRQVSNER
jgi:hypothetical protein